MSTGYKLTTQEMTAYGGFQWEIGRWVETTGEGDLCGPGWLHYYEDPLLAVLHNPIHADVKNPRLFRVEVEGKVQRQGQMKAGCTRMRLVEELPVPQVTITQRVAYAILCARDACDDTQWRRWADRWLSGDDRSETAARAARVALAAKAEEEAARAAAEAAWAAWAEAAKATWSVAVARAVAAAEAAAARAAAWAEKPAWAAKAKSIDLIAIARQSIEHY